MDLNRESLPVHANIYIWQGDYTEVDVPFVDQADAVFNLTGYTGKADIMQNNIRLAGFDITINAVEGKAVLSLESNITALIPPGVYAYDFQLQDTTLPVPRVKTFMYGQVIVRGQITEGYRV